MVEYPQPGRTAQPASARSEIRWPFRLPQGPSWPPRRRRSDPIPPSQHLVAACHHILPSGSLTIRRRDQTATAPLRLACATLRCVGYFLPSHDSLQQHRKWTAGRPSSLRHIASAKYAGQPRHHGS